MEVRVWGVREANVTEQAGEKTVTIWRNFCLLTSKVMLKVRLDSVCAQRIKKKLAAEASSALRLRDLKHRSREAHETHAAGQPLVHI